MHLGCWSEKGIERAAVCTRDVIISSQSQLLDVFDTVQAVGQELFRLPVLGGESTDVEFGVHVYQRRQDGAHSHSCYMVQACC